MSSDTWILSNDLCRCCHAEGCFKILNVPCCNEDGETEVYSEMLREQLGVDIQQVDGILSESTYKICEKCIERLKDVVLFKKQVITCENKFKDLLAKGRFQAVKLEILNNEVKTEDDENEGYIGATDLHDSDSDDASFQMKFSDEDSIDKDTEDEPETKKRKGKSKVKARAKTKSLKKEKPKKESTQRSGQDEKKKVPNEEDYQLITKDGVNKVYCNRCGTILKCLRSLNSHLDRIHRCDKCPLVFISKALKLEHLKVTHNWETVRGRFICDYCLKEFEFKTAISSHIRRNHVEQKCLECNKVFLTKHNLNRHNNRVHPKRIYNCGACEYSSPYRSVVCYHQRRVHLKEKSIKCEQCDMRFFSKANLNEHMIKHGGKQKYICGYCGKGYPRRITLKMHLRIHTGDKRKVCTICKESFVQRSSLNYHMLSRHPDKV